MEIDVRKVPVDYLSITGHKIGAPKGIGALYVRRKAPFVPLIYGGHQEKNRRGGTESVALIVGLGKAAELAREKLADYDKTVRRLRDALEEGILGTGSSGRESAPSASPKGQSRLTSAATRKPEGAGIPNTELNGHKTLRLAKTTNITFHGIESEALLILLDQEGICASSGSACLADSDEPSHVVKAMKPDSGASRQMIRFSLGVENTGAQIKTTVAVLQRATAQLRACASHGQQVDIGSREKP